MLVTLADMKSYLGITASTYDSFLTSQLNLISSAIENYCGRVFTSSSYTQTFYKADFQDVSPIKKIDLYHYPVTAIASVTEIETSGGVDTETILDSSEYRLHSLSGSLKKIDDGYTRYWFSDIGINSRIEIEFTAGFSTIPYEIQEVTKSLVEERYNKYINGVDLSFGPDVQRISIPGTISIDYDYSLQANDRKSKFGMIIGNYANVLDFYRSERAIIGSVREAYVS